MAILASAVAARKKEVVTAASVVNQTTVGALIAWAAARITAVAIAAFAVWALIAFAVVKTAVEALVTWAKARIRAMAVLASAAAARKKEVATAASVVNQTVVGALFAWTTARITAVAIAASAV